MGKASSSKKVSRAARTGGGRTARGRATGLWPALIVFVVMLGLVLIVASRNERSEAASERPRVLGAGGTGDHWHSAYGIFICDKFLPDLPDNLQLGAGGIHTHADGLVHVEAQNNTEAGKNATLGKFVSGYPGMELSSTSIRIPTEQKTYKNGDKCGDKAGRLQVKVNGKVLETDPKKLRLRDLQRIVISFAPEGTDIPDDPPSSKNLADPNASHGGGQQGQQGQQTEITVAPGETTPTPAPGAPGATAPPGSAPAPAPPSTGTPPTPAP